MKAFLELGPAPSDEPCVAVEPSGAYRAGMKEECLRYMALLEKMFGVEPQPGMYFSIHTFRHEFGPYSEVCINFDDADELHVQTALTIEEHAPRHWDEA